MKAWFVLVILGFSRVAVAADTDPIPPEVFARQTCQEHVVQEPRMTAGDLPDGARGREYKAYVVVSYRLDGSGKATDPHVVDSRPRRLFAKTTLGLLARTEFTPGVIHEECTYVRTYSAVRRGGR